MQLLSIIGCCTVLQTNCATFAPRFVIQAIFNDVYARKSYACFLNIRHISIINGSNREKAYTGNKKHYTNTYGSNKSLSWYRFISGFVWKKSRVDIPKGLAWLYYDNWVQWLYLRTNRNILWQKQEEKCHTNVMNY